MASTGRAKPLTTSVSRSAGGSPLGSGGQRVSPASPALPPPPPAAPPAPPDPGPPAPAAPTPLAPVPLPPAPSAESSPHDEIASSSAGTSEKLKKYRQWM